ncbi:YeiH family protein [Denitrificimonas sp. JX-1]|uniref:YeiH family protein n=1 Tax=Denitrificimonas halotolerans TaxID=3098930 RepID=A0ABU5GQX6_9GAMM|nr:YeiH family protein [Denitrificimonas sp. JX-1]MDY7218775.1 YeiH family protein [Denitrificimonas sp. JX-1]
MFAFNRGVETTKVRLPQWLQWRAELLPGLLLCAVIAGAAMLLDRVAWLQAHGLSALTLAILLGFVLGNILPFKFNSYCAPGVHFAKQYVLRLGIILYGFRLTFQDVSYVGLAGVVIDALVIISTFVLAVLLGVRLFKLDRGTAMLIGIGNSICGAAAIMAAEPVLKARAEQVTVAVSTVVVFGTLAIFLYPLLYSLNESWQLLGTTDFAYGLFVGSTVHEVAQVVAAGAAISPEAANTAVIAKMVRVMMLAPFLILLALYLARHETPARVIERGSCQNKGLLTRVNVPWFAFIFVAVAGFNSLQWLPEVAIERIIQLDTALLAAAMAGLGLSTDMKAIRRAGVRPLLLATILFAWLLLAGGALNYFISAWLTQ